MYYMVPNFRKENLKSDKIKIMFKKQTYLQNKA